MFREKDEGLKHHKLFKNDEGRPENKYTKDCDAHYKVTYLLLQRDLKGQNVIKEAESRLQSDLNNLTSEKQKELRDFRQ
jgi:hypothetical protein